MARRGHVEILTGAGKTKAKLRLSRNNFLKVKLLQITNFETN